MLRHLDAMPEYNMLHVLGILNAELHNGQQHDSI